MNEWICEWFIQCYPRQQWHTDQVGDIINVEGVFVTPNKAAYCELRQSSV